MDSEQPNRLDQASRDAHLADERPLQAQPSDLQLWQAMAQGHSAAFEALYDRHAPLVYGIALKILGSAPEAEDLTQDVFLKLVDGSSYDPQRGSLRTFLAILTRSRALDRVRSRQRRARRAAQSQADAARSPEMGDPTLIDVASQYEQNQEVQAALADLSSEQRQILKMTYYDGLTQATIAERLNIPVGTVKSRARRGLLKLRQVMEKGLM